MWYGNVAAEPLTYIINILVYFSVSLLFNFRPLFVNCIIVLTVYLILAQLLSLTIVGHALVIALWRLKSLQRGRLKGHPGGRGKVHPLGSVYRSRRDSWSVAARVQRLGALHATGALRAKSTFFGRSKGRVRGSFLIFELPSTAAPICIQWLKWGGSGAQPPCSHLTPCNSMSPPWLNL